VLTCYCSAQEGIILTRDYERTHDIYEHIPGYVTPPSVPLPDPDDRRALESLGVKPGRFSYTLADIATRLMGFKSFQRDLPAHIDDLLRTKNLRGPGLFAPVIAATLVMADDPRPLEPVERAATLLFAARHLRDDIMTARLSQDELRGQPLEMGQYPNLFGTSLIVDGTTPRIFKTDRVTQITVAVGGRFFLLDVGDLSRETTLAQVVAALRAIVAQAQAHPLADDELSPGILTSGTAKTQVRAFSRMQQLEPNRVSLEAMRHSLLTLCLDLDSKPVDDAEAGYLSHTGNPDNRWHNSSLQLVVFGNAKATAICNFNAYVDGNTMMRGVAEIQRRALDVAVPHPLPAAEKPLTPAKALSWNVPPEAVAQARKDLEWVRGDADATFLLPGFGKTFFAQRELPPVPTFIVALAMATRKLVQRPVHIAQFLSMTKYCCMGVLTEIVTTPEMNQFIDYVLGDEVEADVAMRLLADANESQKQVVRAKRSYFPLRNILSLFMSTQKGFGRAWSMGVLALTVGILRLFGRYEQKDVDVIASHPAIYPEIPVVGRPGIRLPYAREFGLHYQIWDDHTTIVMMPSLKWSLPNQEIILALQESLERIGALSDLAAKP